MPKSKAPIQFLTSAKEPEFFPPADRPELALVGRSNAGKSSFINALNPQRGAVAKVSASPGKTRLLNFFEAGKLYRLVDMPGYGFASRSRTEQNTWEQMVVNYIESRVNLIGLLLIMDIRRNWEEDEENICQWMRHRGLPVALVLNKCDKVSSNEARQRIREFKGHDVTLVFAVSSLTRQGCDELEDTIFKTWIKPAIGVVYE